MKKNLLCTLITMFLFAVVVSAQTKTVNVNLYTTTTYSNTQWNNWNAGSTLSFNNFNYSDGTASTIDATLSASTGMVDNGTTWTTTMCPQQVARYATYYSGTSRTLVISGLDNAKKYSISLYSSRNNSGQSQRFTVNSTNVDITSSQNKTNAATFTGLTPTSGSITVTMRKLLLSTYDYLNGFTITEVANQAPVVSAGSAQTITLPTSSVTLTGTATDADGTIASRAWSFVSGPATPTIATPSNLSTSVTGMTTAGSYVFRLTATDNSGASASATVTITVNTTNQPPVVSAGSPQTITLPTSSVNLAGTATDADGTIASRTWSFVSGPVTPGITTPSSTSTAVTGLTTAGSYVFRLTATDNGGASASSTVTITVNAGANQPPVVSAGSNQSIALPTSSVTLTGTATDADGTIASRTWSFVSGPATPSIATPSALSTTVTGLTAAGTYTFRLTATDNSGASSSATVTVTVSLASVFDPADPDVIFTSTNRPALPAYGPISKWGHTNRLTWSGQRPFNFGFKSYYYKGMSFRLKFPKSYQHNVNDGKKYPVLFFLHGLGERGDAYDNEYQLLHGGQVHAQKINDGAFDGFLVYTQSESGFHQAYFARISELIDSLVKYVKVDIDRAIISGLSSGGQSTWDFMADYYSDFSAAIPISAAQDEDMPTYPRFVTVPIWTANGGLDNNPTPEAVTTTVNYFKSLGGNIRQTYYPTQGHGVWNSFWDQADYFPTLSTYHKANPLVYFGRTEFCPNDAVSVRMGLQAGFNAYEWQSSPDGATWTTISGATSSEYTASAYGQYRARFKRTAAGVWSDWSPSPIVVKQKAGTVSPPIEISGLKSNVLPAPDGSTTVPLTVPGNFVSYEWRNAIDNSLVGSSQIYNATAGQYKVQVTEQYGCSSSFSGVYTVINANGANKPDKPSSLAATTLSNSSIRLDWNDNPNPVNNETGFEIYQSTSTGGPYTLVAITAADVLTYNAVGLSPNTNYYYVIRAINNSGASDIASEVAAKTQTDTQAPTAPSGLRVTGSNRYSVSLAWNASTDDVGVSKYDVYVNGSKAYTTSDVTFTVNNLTQGQKYAFVVKARDFVGNTSTASNQVTGSAVLNGLTYKYYEFAAALSNLPDFNTLTPTYTGATPNVDITLRAKDDNFAFLWEGYINITVAGTYYFRTNSDDGSRLWLGSLNGKTSPYAFGGTSLVNNDGIHGSQNATSSAISLQVGTYPIAIAFFEQSGGEGMTVSWRTPSTGTSYVTIPNSAFQDAQPVTVSPVSPSALNAVAASYNTINLTWTDNSNNESGFEIWRSTDASSNFAIVGTTAPNAVSYSDTTVAPNTTYYYQLRAIGLTGESAFIPDYIVDANWKFNNNYTDASGNGKTLTGNNTPTFNTDKKEGTHSLDLDGSSEDVTVNTAAGDYIRGGFSAKTIAFWMRSDVANSNRGIFDFGGSDDGLAMRLNSNQIIAGIANNNVRASISASYNSTAWNHIALVYSGNTLRLYVNGAQVAANTSLSFTSVGTTTDASMIGDDNGTNALNTTFGQFDGRFDDFWVLGSALSAADITKLMNGTFTKFVSATTQGLPAIPAAPSALVATAASTSSITISWSDNSVNETGFEIWRSANNNTSYRLLATTAANAVNYTDEGLFANVTYYYKVLAKGVGGNSVYSNEANAITKNNAPIVSDIANFTMRFDSQKTVDIIATDADGETLTILPGTLPAFAAFNNAGNGEAQIVFSPDNSQLGVYPIRIIANDTHNGADTLDFVLTVDNNYVPVINPIADVTVNENSPITINLSATDQDGNSSLQWLSTGLPAFAQIVSGTDGQATLQLSPNFAQAGAYPVTVSVADGAGGVGTYSFTITVNNVEPNTNKWYVNIRYNDYTGGPAPWNNINTPTGGNNLKDQNNNTTPVSLQFLTNAWNIYNGGAQTGNNSGVYPDNVLRDYYYFGIFGAPETVDFRLSNLEPGYKYNITLMAGSSWTGVANNGTTVFTINGNSQSLYTQNNTSNTVTFTSLVPDASGNLVVTMSKAPGTPVGYLNAFVLEKIFDDGTAPVMPADLAAQSNEDGSIKLTWTDIAYNELSYNVYRSTSVDGTYTLLNPGASNNNTTVYTDNNVSGRTTYYYKIAAVNNYGSSALTDAVSIVTPNKAPVVAAINNVYVKGNTSSSVTISSSDDAGETLTAVVTNLPSFATFTNNGNGGGTITMNPGVGDLGLFKDVTVTVTDNFGLSSVRKFDISVSDNSTRSIYVNMAGEFGTPESKPWNNFVAYPFANWGIDNLADDQGITTSYKFRILQNWTSSWQGGMITGNNSGIYPDNVIKTSIYDGTTETKRLQFTGLDPAKTYNIAVFSSNNAGFDASFTLASGSQSLVSNARFNSTRTTQLNGLSPDASGVLEFTITKAAAAKYVFLNAIVLQEYNSISTTPIRPIEMFTEINEPGKINLSWSDRSSNETGFEIWRGTAGQSFTLLTTTAANVSTYTDNSALTNIRYFYKVRAKNGTTFSDYSNTANAKLGENTVLLNLNLATPQAAPWNNTNNTPQAGAGATDMKNTVGNNTGYSMVLTNNWGGYFDLGMTGGILPDNVMLTSWWIEGNSQPGTFKLYNLDQSKRYRIGFMGSSSWEGDFTATYTINDRTVYLNGFQNKSKIVYIDNVIPNNDGEINVSMSYLAATRWSFLSAVTIEAYDYDSDMPPAVIANRAAQTNETAQTAVAKPDTEVVPAAVVAPTVVRTEVSAIDEVKLFPNPFTDALTVSIKVKSAQKMAVRILDISGRLIITKDLGIVEGSKTLSLTSSETGKLQPGMYIVQLVSNDKIGKTFKVIKAR